MTDTVPPRKTLHSKRSFGKQMRSTLDSPAYDASEEDNDPLTDDAASAVSVSLHAARLPASSSSRPRAQTARQGPARHALAVLVSDDDGGTDSPTYDGDIESTQGPDGAQPSGSHSSAPSVASTLTSPVTLPATHLPEPESDHAGLLPPPSHEAALLQKGLPAEPAPAGIAVEAFDPAKLTPADIREFVRRAIAGEGPDGAARPYKINPPPKDRPARIYADGVYDLFHFAHALQLRQAKLAFPPLPASATSPSPSPLATHSTASSGQPSPLDTPVPQGMVPGVYLLVGVNSDEQCVEHKNLAVMSHAERCEAVRHCRWVDEVVPEAPWVIDEDFLQKYQIDYVAHDEDPYVSAGSDDVYGYCKHQGKFLPTRRTPGISTSDLLERIVSRYRMRVFDKKLARMGHAELMAEGSDYDDSAPGSVRASRAGSPGPVR